MVYSDYMNKTEYVLRHRDKKRKAIDELKSNPCMDCGRDFPPYVMHFDHRDSSLKVRGIGNMWSYSMSKILQEIEKCDLVCSNCHAIRTWNRAHNIGSVAQR